MPFMARRLDASSPTPSSLSSSSEEPFNCSYLGQWDA
ncbi:hypothetical protein D9613_010654 [Agrocybe pediades]|uniref:Uncharacterized protein n=1 Tax=Agrocybe pediades TaxID=84607 RepID=A0A8H4VJK0_9AGAR|nr:hypothetical protein D9613_010654 [Agrocybe pediades]